MSAQVAWGKFLIWSSIIMASGYGLMKATTPSEKELYDALSPELKRRVDQARAEREGRGQFERQVQASLEADKPIWGSDLDAAKGRRV